MEQKINLIAAVGLRGQIGRDGNMPWSNAADLIWFRETTMGGVVIVGARTRMTLNKLPGREICVYQRHDDAETMLKQVKVTYPGRKIWIIGGAKTYFDFAPFVDGLRLISAVDYDNNSGDDDAHTFFPFSAYGIRWMP